jgi:hypothetical protein
MALNNELEWMWEEAVVAELEICLEGVRKAAKNLGVPAEIRIAYVSKTIQKLNRSELMGCRSVVPCVTFALAVRLPPTATSGRKLTRTRTSVRVCTANIVISKQTCRPSVRIVRRIRNAEEKHHDCCNLAGWVNSAVSFYPR